MDVQVSSAMESVADCAVNRRFLWVIIAPLGTPVVPDEDMMYSG